MKKRFRNTQAYGKWKRCLIDNKRVILVNCVLRSSTNDLRLNKDTRNCPIMSQYQSRPVLYVVPSCRQSKRLKNLRQCHVLVWYIANIITWWTDNPNRVLDHHLQPLKGSDSHILASHKEMVGSKSSVPVGVFLYQPQYIVPYYDCHVLIWCALHN